MATLAQEIGNILRWYATHLRRRGAVAIVGEAAPSAGDKDDAPEISAKRIAEGIRTKRIFLAAKRPAEHAGEVVDGVRLLPRNVVAVLVPASAPEVFSDGDNFAATLAAAAAEGERLKFDSFDVHVIGTPPVLRSTLSKPTAKFVNAHKAVGDVEYFCHARFITDIQRHAHARALKHTIMTRDEINKLLRFYRMDVDLLSVMPAADPQCIWIGATHGDIIRVAEATSSNTSCVGYFRTAAVRLKK